MSELHGRVVVITGASSGIGYATALRFAEEGCHLGLVARREEALESVARECRDRGVETLVLPCDVADEEAVATAAERVRTRFRRIDVWINNASVVSFGKFEDVPADVFRRVVDVNFFGTVHGCRAALPIMEEQRSGHLVNVASTYARLGIPYWSPYVSAKFAVRGFSESLRQEVREKGIEVSTVFPSAIDTPLWECGANYAGRKPKATSPTFDPVEVADALVACVKSPRDEVPVGFPSKIVARIHDLSPALWARIGPTYVAKNQFLDEPAEATQGSVFVPTETGARMRGGWASQHPPSKPVRALIALALLAGPLAAALLAPWLMRRRREPAASLERLATRTRQLVA